MHPSRCTPSPQDANQWAYPTWAYPPQDCIMYSSAEPNVTCTGMVHRLAHHGVADTLVIPAVL